MNNVLAGVMGGIAVVAVAGSAMVFASRTTDEADAGSSSKKEVAYKTVCTDEQVTTTKKWGTNSVVGTVLGGAAGGVVGHQIGGGSGKDVATAVGAVGGAYAGHRIANEKFPDKEVSTRQNCREVPVSG